MSTPNIIWVTLDSVRRDHTSLASYDRDTTPNLRRIARHTSGEEYPNCISHSEWTRGSVGSMLTGLYPNDHGIGFEQNRRLGNEIDTVAELLAERGYRTACLTENPLVGPTYGLERGFDRYQGAEPVITHLREHPKLLFEHFWRVDHRSAGLSLNSHERSPAFLTTQIAKRWLSQCDDRDDPFFLYLHYNEPHRPYHPPRQYLSEYVTDIEMAPDEAYEFTLHVHENLYEIVANGCRFSESEWEALRAAYDAEIAYTDDCVGELFDRVRKLDSDDTIFLVTADHGELFGEHSLLAHKVVLSDELIRVPLVVHGDNPINHGTNELVQHVDLVRTLLEEAGVQSDQLQGVNLQNDVREHAISQRGGMSYERDITKFKEFNPSFDDSRFHSSLLTAVRTSRFKFLKSPERTELFDLPDETVDVSDEFSATGETLHDVAESHHETARWNDESSEELSEEIRAKLSDLGYLVD